MSLARETYQAYCDILKEELRLAMGCTEPIALAYAAAMATAKNHWQNPKGYDKIAVYFNKRVYRLIPLKT